MSTLPIHVIANGDLFREGFNAIVTVLGTSTFNTATKLAILFSIIGAACSYIQKNDIVVLAKWFILYFAVTVIILGPKVDVQILDSSNPGAVYSIGNVPIGLALPASLITSAAQGIETAMETAFHLPDDAQYSKTGMLFGSRIFKLSTGFHFVDPDTKSDFNEYVKNCVVGDILINQKYSVKDLLNSPNIWSTITKSPSPIRGVFFHDHAFRTCAAATPILKKEIADDVKNNSFTFFGLRIFGGKDPTAASLKLQNYLPSAYNYYANLSHSASQIMTQNVLINGIRDGIMNYGSEAGATAALLNLSSTQAMERMRMSWATSKNMATYVLPVMQVDILLLMLCLFPIIVLLTLQPAFGTRVFKHYVYSLIWVESWPILFACLNLAVTFYVQNKTSGLASSGLTLANSNSIALEHSDVANMAGYLMTCVPFIAIGIVRGMAFAFNNAANYIGGMLHSTAAGAGNEAVSGNISLGNMSYGNVNANKFDTNSTYMHGMATEQLKNGATVMHTAEGSDVWNVAPGISHLATSVNASSAISASLSTHAEAARSAAIQDQHAYNHAISDASSTLEHFNQSMSATHGVGENFSTGEAASVTQHASELHGLVNNVAERNGVSWNEAFKGMSSFAQGAVVGGEISASTPLKALSGVGIGGKIGVNARYDHSRSNDESTGHDVGTHLNVSNEEMQKFSRDWGAVQSFNKNEHAESGSSEGMTQLSQLAADFREASSASENYASNLSVSERLSHLANFSEQHATQINSNFNQGFADYVQNTTPDKADYLLGNTNNVRAIEELNVLANRYVNSSEFMGKIESLYQQGSDGINPTQMYQEGNATVSAIGSELPSHYQDQAMNIQNKSTEQGARFDERGYSQVEQQVNGGQQNVNTHLQAEEGIRQNSYRSAHRTAQEHIEEGAEKADLSPGGDVASLIAHPIDTFTTSARNIEPDFVKKEDQ